MRMRILPGAASELQNTAAYYEAQQSGLGKRFLDVFDAGAQDIAIAPAMYSPIGNGYRKFGLRPFPYAIIYRTEADTIVIIAVMHQMRRPDYWRGRE